MLTYILSFTGLFFSSKSPCSGKTSQNQITGTLLSRLSMLFIMSLFLTAQGQNHSSYSVNGSRNSNGPGAINAAPTVQVNVANAACTDSGSVTLAQTGAWSSYILTDGGKSTLSNGVLNQNQDVTITLPAGTYTLTLTDSAGQTSAQTVVISGATYPAPIAEFQITTGSSLAAITQVQAGQRIVATAGINGPATYSWNFGDGAHDSDGVASTTYKSAGSYAISLVTTNPAGCSATSTQTLTVTEADVAAGVYNVSGNGAPAIWSNNNTVYVDFRDVADMDATVNIYDVTGKQLSSERSGQLVYQKQIDNTSAGYFIIDVNNHDKTTTKKVFIGNAR